DAGLDYRFDKTLLFVGTLIERKGLDLLLEALSLVKDRDWRLLIAGDGHDRQKLIDKAEALGLSDKAEFLGFKDPERLKELYEKSSIFILPSREDCFGLVTLEAMCCALPVICSKYADGGYDLIEDGKTGYIIDTYDTAGFAKKIDELLSDEKKCRQMSKAGKQKSLEFDFKITAEGYIKAIESAMNKTDIIYVSAQCSEGFLSEHFKDLKNLPGQQAQKYNRLLARGLACKNEITVHHISQVPMYSGNERKLIFFKDETDNNVHYHYLPVFRIHKLQDILNVITGFFTALKLMKGKDRRFLLNDVLCAPASYGAMLAARLRRIKTVSIVTDVPDILYENIDNAYHRYANKIIASSDAFVLLTEQMNRLVNPSGKPYVIIEGLVDAKAEAVGSPKERASGDSFDTFEASCNKSDADKSIGTYPRIILYTGTIDRKYGIENLVKGFVDSGIKDAELHIYGNGDYKEDLLKLSEGSPSIKYCGTVLNDEMVRIQKSAFLLINPRSFEGEYTLYSFPSKNLEYMATGVPSVMAILPGMPKEYGDHVFKLKDASAKDICETLRMIFSISEEDLYNKGRSAYEFVINNKSNTIQADRLIAMTDKMK
ncbi:MAG: glycosyltransferase, partial [Lachnospiraceae bacterium]|nr:glycosyltransferase [Lachnospiraceae bacterium]